MVRVTCGSCLVENSDIVEIVVAHIEVDNIIFHTAYIVALTIFHSVVAEIVRNHDVRNSEN